MFMLFCVICHHNYTEVEKEKKKRKKKTWSNKKITYVEVKVVNIYHVLV